MDLLLLSNSTNHGSAYLAHAEVEARQFLEGVSELTFVPFAGGDHAAYTAKVAEAFRPWGIRVRGIDEDGDPLAALASAEAVFVGGGNTFRLVDKMQRTGVLSALADRVNGGMRYMGASAGTNIAAPTLRTTNDMPIVEPATFDALALVPVQINPHYLDADPTSSHNGETRQMRIAEFHEENEIAVLGLREGTHLRVSGSLGSHRSVIGGTAAGSIPRGPALLFRRGQPAQEIEGDVSEYFPRY